MAENQVQNTEFNFDTWVTELNLPRKVSQILRQEELTTKDTLILLNEGDVKSLGLPLGSAKLLIKVIKEWQAESVTSADTEDQTSEKEPMNNEATLDGAGKLLDELLSTQTPSQLHTKNHHVDGISTFMDPRSILTMKAQTKKAVHITQFLSEKSKRRKQNKRKEYVLKSSESETIVFKTDDEHPYLGIQMEEWGAANMRILNHLLSVNSIERGDVEYYLAYTTRIFEFAETYDWNSVLNYD